MIYLAAYGYSNGNVYNAFRGIDKYGNQCGLGTTASYPYLYFVNPITPLLANILDNRVCVSSCPYWNGSAVVQVSCMTSSDCTYTFTYDSSGVKSTGTGTTPSGSDLLGYDSSVVAGRVCIPSSSLFAKIGTNTSN